MKIYMAVTLAVIVAACGGQTAQTTVQSNPVSTATPGAPAGQQINAIRSRAGLPSLRRNSLLDRAALAHAQDMAANSFMSHTGSDGSTLRKRVNRTGYVWCTLGENVSRGHRTNARAIEGWRTSPGHYKNMVNAKAREYGFANVNGFRTLVVGSGKC